MHPTSSIPLDEDPLDMFGGTPAPTTGLDSNQMNSNQQTDDFFADFSEAPSTTATATTAAVPNSTIRHSIPSPGINTYSEVDLAEDTNARSQFVAQPSPPPPPPLQTAGSATSSGSFKDRISEQPAATKASHKAFQFLDAKQGTAGAQAQAQPSRNSRLDGPSFDDGYHQQQQQQQGQQDPSSSSHTGHGIAPTAESVVELGQRAAKALQMGTKWFMKASKQIATEVQSKIEKHRHYQHNHDNSLSGSASGGMTTSHSFYFDWASQIVRMSPGTRAAAMGAMQEDDRMEVQRIIDEAELGEVMLNSSNINSNSMNTRMNLDSRNGSGSGGNGPLEQGRRRASDWSSSDDEQIEQQQQQRPRAEVMPPPPSYDELMGSAAANKGQASNSSPPVATTVDSKVVEHEKDLLGFSGRKPAAATAVPEDDLLRMDGDNSTDTNTAHSNGGGTGHIDDLFTVHKATTAAAAAAPARSRSSGTASASTTTTSTTAAARKGSGTVGGLDSMIDLGNALSDVDTTGYSELYVEKTTGVNGGNGVNGGEDPNEPEIRKVLREKRIAEKHERMKQQLAEKRAREEAEDAEKAGKVAFRDTLKPKIDAWSSNKKDNIRALLSTVHTVLWEDSGWTAPSIADMVDPGKVKKWYMKANLVVHPDKVKQKGGTLEQVATADMVFDVLKGAWGKFEASK
jgi:hypothetical protein